MKSTEEIFIDIMHRSGIDIVASLPCDRLKNLIPLIDNTFYHVPITREESGVGICAGAYMAGSRPMAVIQSTGLGNMINALESLNISCQIPLPILASWRGVYKEKIEAQKPLGEHLPSILEGAGISYTIIDRIENIHQLETCIEDSFKNHRPHVILVSPIVWEGSICSAWAEEGQVLMKGRSCNFHFRGCIDEAQMLRYDAINTIAPHFDDEVVVCNIGIPSKELYSIKDRDLNYYMFGSMGLASSIGAGIAIKSDRKVVVLDGDGSLLMNPNALFEAAFLNPANLIIIALDNGAYGSTGSQKTLTSKNLDLEFLALACGFENTIKVHTPEELLAAYQNMKASTKMGFIHVILKPGNAKVANIPIKPADVTRRFMRSLSNR
ncbi:sulfopyruvate decarboxylase subunit beta [Methanosalsum zhilinae]|nr:sulfopyruvate decarboxylase subunit beta [Methanosalsum zhilinae]